ncbi:MAG TPA: DCC1-like thiol-disulfide oxidoreductase family protein [Anaeromyxobacteraceae bacterium]|nr:DCC1-like thiol-disulfide oxidoreductase family protein [Anaeromyxobacteraceae bacterium]
MAAGAGEDLVLYDGACGLCSRLVRFVLRRDRTGHFVFASLQGEVGRATLARLGRPEPALDTLYVVAGHRTAPVLLERSRAALFVAARLPRPWSWLGALGILPRSLLDRAYDLVARHRHGLFPPAEGCLVPGPEERGRFLGRD